MKFPLSAFPMNIALNSFYLPSIDKIGVGYQAHYMAQALVQRGHRVVMYSPAPRCEDADYEHRQIDCGTKFRLHRFAWAMRRQDLREFDVLHSHGEDHFILSGRVPCHVRTVLGSCLEEAFHIQGIKQKVRMLYIAAMETLACAVADRTVAISVNTCRYYPWISRVIPCGVDLSDFYPGAKESTPTLLFVGTYHNRKRGKWLMEVFQREVRPRLPEAKLWMVCSDAPNADGVEVLGRLTTAQLADRYRRAWAFCLPSTYEGFGVPYIEAMASGTAVVTTANPGSVEVLDNGQWGKLVSDADLGHAIVNVLSDQAERQRLEALGLQRATRYGWDTIAAEYETLYGEVLGEAKAKSGKIVTV